MTLPATAVLEVRATGSDLNAGGFDPATGTTDYSQQDAAVLSLSDIACTGSATAVITSATGGFTSLMVGNYLQISSGTLFTAGFYRIAAFTSTTQVTLDRTPASSASAASGGVGRVGGSLASPGLAAGAIVAGNTVYIKSGTYLIGAGTANTSGSRVSLTVGASATSALRFIGYGVTRGDQGAKPVLQISADLGSSNALLSNNGQAGVLWDNLDLNGNSLTTTGNNALTGTGGGNRVARCRFRNWKSAGALALSSQALVHDCEFTGNASASTSGRGTFTRCYFHDNTAVADGANTNTSFRWCLFANNTGASTDAAACAVNDHNYHHCVFYNSGRHGVNLSSLCNPVIENCIFWGNGSYGVTSANFLAVGRIAGCAGGSNTSGNLDTNATAMVEGAAFIALTANPFVDAANGNFALNNIGDAFGQTTGLTGVIAGRYLRGAGLGTFPVLPNTVGYPDIGAVQSQASSGGLRRIGFTAGIGG